MCSSLPPPSRPFTQGHLSSLCGLYALLNGVQLALWPHSLLTPAQLKKLFARSVEHLDNERILPAVLRAGITENAWLRLCLVVIGQAVHLTGTRLRRRFFLQHVDQLTGGTALADIKRELRQGHPVVVMLWGGYNHATVIVGYDRTRLILFDSAGYRWILLTSVGLHHASSTKRHQLTRNTVVAL